MICTLPNYAVIHKVFNKQIFRFDIKVQAKFTYLQLFLKQNKVAIFKINLTYNGAMQFQAFANLTGFY